MRANLEIMIKPEFVAIGHATHDIYDDKIRVGGASVYSAITAKKLGINAGIITTVGKDFQG